MPLESRSKLGRTRARGLALALVLMVIPILLVLTVGIGAVALTELNATGHINRARQASLAADAGISRTIAELCKNNRLGASEQTEILFENSEVASSRARYTVSITNNFYGDTVLEADDGTDVPPGRAYLRSWGKAWGNKVRESRAMLTTGHPFPYALASGGNIRFDKLDGSVVKGSVKCNGDFELGDTLAGALVMTGLPQVGNVLQGGPLFSPGGDLLVSGRMLNSLGVLVMGGLFQHEQAVRVRGEIEQPGLIQGASILQAQDDTEHSAPFIADGRLSNLPIDREIMPFPDRSKMFESDRFIVHPEHTVYRFSLNPTRAWLRLDDQVHYYPNGVHFQPGSLITGRGTIVVGAGSKATFDIPLSGGQFNVVALGDLEDGDGQTEIEFNGLTVLRGLVYAHGGIRCRGVTTLSGRMVSYRGDLIFEGVTVVEAREHEISIPGFDNFFAQKTNKPVGVVSWQRS